MRYEVFKKEQLERLPGEGDQAHMERIIKAACEPSGVEDPRINEMMSPTFVECSAEDASLTLSFFVEDWMQNPLGTLQGGLMTTALDMTMGLLGRYVRSSEIVVTAELTVNYMRGIKGGTHFTVEAQAQKQGKRILFMAGKVRTGEGDLAATMSALFM